MMLKRVVLPEPLGPMRAVMVPSLTDKDAPSTARTPPNTLVTSCTDSRSLMAHLHPVSTTNLCCLGSQGPRARPRPPHPFGDGDGAAAGGPRWSGGSRAAGAG